MSSSKTAYKVAIHNRFASLDSDVESESKSLAAPVVEAQSQRASATREFTSYASTEGGFVGAGRGRGRGARGGYEGPGERVMTANNGSRGNFSERGNYGDRGNFGERGNVGERGGGPRRRVPSPVGGSGSASRGVAPAATGGDEYSGPSGDETARPQRRPRWIDGAGTAPAGAGRRLRSGVATGEQARRHGRDFDRHSGARQRGNMKKLGAGGHNWGNARNDYEPLVGGGGEEAAANSQFAEMPAGTTGPSELQLSPPGLTATQNEQVEGDGGEHSPDSFIRRAGDTGDAQPEGEEGARPQGQYQGNQAQQNRTMTIDFIQYQKSLRQRKANAQDILTTNLGAARCVDDSTLERDGYERYQREETEDERAQREQREREAHALTDDDEYDEKASEDATSRPKTYNFFELTGEGNRRGRGRGNRGRGGRHDAVSMEKQVAPAPQPIHIDLHDANAFPALG